MSGRALVDGDEGKDRNTVHPEVIAWYMRLRWVAIAGALALAAVARFVGIRYPVAPVLGVLSIAAAANLSFTLCKRDARCRLPCPLRNHTEACLTGELSLDWLVLLLLLRLTGGIENPLLILVPFQACLAGMLLSVRRALDVSLAGTLIFCAMTLAELRGALPHVTPVGFLEIGLYKEPLYVGAVCGTLVVVTLGITAVSSVMTQRLLRRGEESRRAAEKLKAASDELSAALERLQKLDEEKSRFLYVAAHELRSPLATIDTLLLTVVQGYAGDVDEKAAGMIKRARNKVSQLLLLVSELLTLSRVKEGLEPSKRVMVDVQSVLGRILEDERVNAEEKSITIDAELPRNIPPLFCTHENVDSLFRNLVHNAVRYTPEGGRVSVKVTIDGAAIHAEVSDTGIGIPPEDLANIFVEFYRTTNAKRFAKTGTGLGLAIVKRVVDTLGGDISVESEVGVGTTFRLWVPGFGSGD